VENVHDVSRTNLVTLALLALVGIVCNFRRAPFPVFSRRLVFFKFEKLTAFHKFINGAAE
jgi:hypothetical protein